MRKILSILIFLTSFSVECQESLLPGELKLEEIKIQPKAPELEKIEGYLAKYKKKKSPKDSVKVVTELYNHLGLLTSKTTVNPNNPAQFSKLSYGYFNDQLVEYAWIQNNNGAIDGRTGTFKYDAKGRCIEQTHSLAIIKYSYDQEGKLTTKSYHYNNGNASSEPWVHHYIYDDNGWLIHVAEDPESKEQTYFYDSTGQLILNDYYPGVAYSTYAYDEKGNCTQQVDFEMGKKGWDSTAYVFTYYPDGKIKSTGIVKKKNRVWNTEEYVYNARGEMSVVYYLRRNKRKRMKRFYFSYR